MDDYIVIGLIILIIGGALFYIIRAKKNGQKCIGCPQSKTCSVKNLKEIFSYLISLK